MVEGNHLPGTGCRKLPPEITRGQPLEMASFRRSYFTWVTTSTPQNPEL